MYGNVGTSFETPTTTSSRTGPIPPAGSPDASAAESHETTRSACARPGGPAELLGSPVPRPNVRDELIGYAYPPPTAPGGCSSRTPARPAPRVELGTEIEIASGMNLVTTWTYSGLPVHALHPGAKCWTGRPPGIPQHWLHSCSSCAAGPVGGWVELEETHSSGFIVDDRPAPATPHARAPGGPPPTRGVGRHGG